MATQSVLTSSPTPAKTNKQPHILIVDDDAAARRLLTTSLKGVGFEVTIASRGAEALEIIQDNTPDIVLLDYEMPGLNGAEVCAWIRASTITLIKELPVIMFTAHTAETEEVGCLSAGANDFVTKPVSLSILQARIHTQLRLRAYALELEKWRESHEADLMSAKATQQAIVPHETPYVPGWEVEAHFEPLIQVGGDIYGWKELSDGRWMFWLADGTGHGVAAALITTLATHLFSSASELSTSPATILNLVNKEFIRVVGGNTFMTACCAVVEENGSMTFSSAGHPPLYVQRHDGRVDSYASKRTILGLVSNISITDFTIEMEKGDIAVFYTDGIYSMKSADGEPFSNEVVEEVLQKKLLNEDAPEDLIARIADIAKDASRDDDIAVITLRKV